MDILKKLPVSVTAQIEKFIKNLYQDDHDFDNLNKTIREDVLDILQKKCTVVFFPLDDDEIDGFHVSLPVNGKMNDFVYINTSKYLEKQIFTAAHELGHMLKLEEHLRISCPDYKDEMAENAVNKFATLLLVPADIFCWAVREKLKIYANNNNNNKSSVAVTDFLRIVVYLMNFFFVPFKTIVYRLYETKFIQKEGVETLLSVDSDAAIEKFINEEKYERLFKPSNKKQIEGYAELLLSANNANIFSDRKIDRIREMFDIHKPVNSNDTSLIILETE